MRESRHDSGYGSEYVQQPYRGNLRLSVKAGLNNYMITYSKLNTTEEVLRLPLRKFLYFLYIVIKIHGTLLIIHLTNISLIGLVNESFG
jgi:hypothetical protein